MAKIISFAKYLYKGGNTGIYKRMFILLNFNKRIQALLNSI